MIKAFQSIVHLIKGDPSLKIHENETGFGTIYGVYIPSVLMMFGVILYLRIGLLTSYIGPLQMSSIIIGSTIIMIITAFSITAIVTNMRVGSGGVYYLISRSLGIEIGSTIGICLYFSLIISISLCTSGFALSIKQLFPDYSIHTLEVTTLVFLTVISVVSADLALKTQVLIFIILIISFISAITGSVNNIEVKDISNFYPEGIKFWEAFAIFFPAVTGIEAGMAMSGTLKNPSRSLPIGTIFSLLTAFTVYLFVALFMYYSIPTYMLKSNPFIMINFASYGNLVMLGIWGATLSSSLASLLGAPRMLQALASDGVFPSIFAKEYGKHKEPRYAIALTFIIALILMLFTNIDQVLTILSMICLVSYGTLNLVAGFAELINNPSWRPTFRNSWILSLIGALLCFSTMFLIDSQWTFISLILIAVIYLIVRKRNIEVSFKDIRESFIFFISRLALYRLSEPITHAMNWHSQLLVFVQSPERNMPLIHFSNLLTKRSGILSFSTIIPSMVHDDKTADIKRTLDIFYSDQNISCLVEVAAYDDYFDGVQNLIKSYGIGPLQPNTIVFPIPYESKEIVDYTSAFETAELMKKNVIVFNSASNDNSKPFRKSFKTRKKIIDIWWDGDYRNNFELILSLVTTLADCRIWKGAKIRLHAVVSDIDAQRNLKEYLDSYLIKSRLIIKAMIHIEPTFENHLPFIQKYSSKADLCFVGLRTVSSLEDRDYTEYFQEFLNHTSKLKSVAYVIANDEVDHKEIYA